MGDMTTAVVVRCLHPVRDLEALLECESNIYFRTAFPLNVGAYETLLAVEEGTYEHEPEKNLNAHKTFITGLNDLTKGRHVDSTLYKITVADLPYLCGVTVRKDANENVIAEARRDFLTYGCTLLDILVARDEDKEHFESPTKPTLPLAAKLHDVAESDTGDADVRAAWLELSKLVPLYMSNYKFFVTLPPDDSEDVKVDPLVVDYYAGRLLTPDYLYDRTFCALGQLLRSVYWKNMNWVELDSLWETLCFKKLVPAANESYYKPLFFACIKTERSARRTFHVSLFTGLEIVHASDDQWNYSAKGFPLDGREIDITVEYIECARPIYARAVGACSKMFKMPQDQLHYVLMHTQHVAALMQSLNATCKSVTFDFASTKQGAAVLKRTKVTPQAILNALRQIFKTGYIKDEGHCTRKRVSGTSQTLINCLPFLDIPMLRYNEEPQYGQVKASGPVDKVVLRYYRSDNVPFRTLFGYAQPRNINSAPEVHKSVIRLMGTFSHYNKNQFTEYGDYKGVTVNEVEYAKHMPTEVMQDGKCNVKYKLKMNFQGHGAFGQVCAYKSVVLSTACMALIQVIDTTTESSYEFALGFAMFNQVARLSNLILSCFANLRKNCMYVKIFVKKESDRTKPMNSFRDLFMSCTNIKASPVVNFKPSEGPNFLERAKTYTFCNQYPQLKANVFFKRVVEDNCMTMQLTEVYNQLNAGREGDVVLPVYYTSLNSPIKTCAIVGNLNYVNARCSTLCELKSFKINEAISYCVTQHFMGGREGLRYETRLDPNSEMYTENLTTWSSEEEEQEVTPHTIDLFVDYVVAMGLPVPLSSINAQGYDQQQHTSCLQLLEERGVEVEADAEPMYVNRVSAKEAAESVAQVSAQKRGMGEAFPKPQSFTKKKKMDEAQMMEESFYEEL